MEVSSETVTVLAKVAVPVTSPTKFTEIEEGNPMVMVWFDPVVSISLSVPTILKVSELIATSPAPDPPAIDNLAALDK